MSNHHIDYIKIFELIIKHLNTNCKSNIRENITKIIATHIDKLVKNILKLLFEFIKAGKINKKTPTM